MKLSCFRITLYTVVNSALEVQKVIKLGRFTDAILRFTWEIPALPFLFPKAVCYIIAVVLTTYSLMSHGKQLQTAYYVTGITHPYSATKF